MQTKRVVPAARCLLVGVYFLAQRQKHRRPSASGAQKSAISLIVLAMAPSSLFDRRNCGSYKKQSRQGIMPGGYGGPLARPTYLLLPPCFSVPLLLRTSWEVCRMSVSYLCLLVGSCLLVGWSSCVFSCI